MYHRTVPIAWTPALPSVRLYRQLELTRNDQHSTQGYSADPLLQRFCGGNSLDFRVVGDGHVVLAVEAHDAPQAVQAWSSEPRVAAAANHATTIRTTVLQHAFSSLSCSQNRTLRLWERKTYTSDRSSVSGSCLNSTSISCNRSVTPASTNATLTPATLSRPQPQYATDPIVKSPSERLRPLHLLPL
eukprot:3025369-Rhodomonas_salina.2